MKIELTTAIIWIHICNKADPLSTHDLGHLEIRLWCTSEWIYSNSIVVAQTKSVGKYKGDFYEMRDADSRIGIGSKNIEVVAVLSDVVLCVVMRDCATRTLLTSIICVLGTTLPLSASEGLVWGWTTNLEILSVR